MKCEMELGEKHQKASSLPAGCTIYVPRVMIPKTKAAKMNTNMKLACLMLVVVVMAQESTAHPCGSTFFSALVQLIPCRSAVAPFSPIPPTEACCASIKALGQPCLCVLVNGPPISGVDRTMATQLPEKCTANFEPCETSK